MRARLPPPRPPRWPALPPALLLALAAMLAGAAWRPALAAGFRVDAMQIRHAGPRYLLDAGMTFELGQRVLDAMENGVGLTIVVETEVLRRRRYLWDQRIARHTRAYQLEKHALSGRFVLTDLASGTRVTYRSMHGMLTALGTLRGLPLLDRQLLLPGERYRVRLRARLDVESLPAPLRPTAWLSPSWRLGSGWHEQELTP